MKRQTQGYSQPARQKGAVLVIALVFLLIITVLAVTSMREVALDSRITGNLIEHKQLFNAAEAGLRDGQYRTVGTPHKEIRGYTPVWAMQAPDTGCPNTSYSDLCLLDTDPVFPQDFSDATRFKLYSPDEITEFSESVHWYTLLAPGGELTGESENPEYGSMLAGGGTFRYEVNSQALAEEGTARLRASIYSIHLGSN